MGHKLDCSKVPEETKQKIIKIWKEQKGEITLQALAERFGHNTSTVRRIIVASGETCSWYCPHCKQNNTLEPIEEKMMIMGKLHNGMKCKSCQKVKWYRRKNAKYKTQGPGRLERAA